MKYQLKVEGSMGYGADQVNSITVGELIEVLRELDENAELVTYDTNNAYGAQFGQLTTYVEEVEEKL